MKTFFTFLSRNKLYTFINVLGLSVSLMFVILIANYIVRCLSTDTSVEHRDKIYAMGNEMFIGSAHKNIFLLKEKFPQIEQICGVYAIPEGKTIIRNTEQPAKFLFVDPSFIDMFSVKIIAGDAKEAIDTKEQVIISQSFANKVFGKESGIGEGIKISTKDGIKEVTIAAIMEDLDNSVILAPDILFNFYAVAYFNSYVAATDPKETDLTATVIFLQERDGANLQIEEDNILRYFKEHLIEYSSGTFKAVSLTPLSSIYFGDKYTTSYTIRKGDKSFVIMLFTVGLLILIFSIVNYINLTVAQAGFRAKEMATRRLLGSSKNAIMYRLFHESLLLCGISFVIGFLIAITLDPHAENLLQIRLSILGDLSLVYIASYCALIIFVALLSGVIPAFILAKYKPVEVVKGIFRRKSNMVYGKILIVVQNIITVALIGCSITLILQTKHLMNAPMGYETKNIINIATWKGFQNYVQVKSTVNELKRLPFVTLVSQSRGTPRNGGQTHIFDYEEKENIISRFMTGDSSFFKMFNISIVQDNKLGENSNRYWTEEFFRRLEISNDCIAVKIGQKENKYEERITGIINDIKTQSALTSTLPCAVAIINSFDEKNTDSTQFMPWSILVKVTEGTDKQEATSKIKEILQKTTNSFDLSVEYIEDEVQAEYADEHRTLNILLIFTIIGLILSSLGLFAMSIYFIQQRRLEIGVRKVFGSTGNEILNRLVNNFMLMVGIAFVIAIPITWYASEWWLQGYPYRIALSPLIFVGAGVFASLIAFITVYWQSSRAANENPVEAIKR